MARRPTSRGYASQFVVIGTMLVVLVLALLGCERESGPSPALLGFDPPAPSVRAGATMYVRLTYDANGARLGNFFWTVAAGSIVGNNLAAVIYEAPPTPGTYRLSVTVPYGNKGQTVSHTGTIRVLPVLPSVPQAPPLPQDLTPCNTTESEATASPVQVWEYTVRRGDTLSRLARRFYGDESPLAWQRIYVANQAVIGRNPSRLRLGMRLRIPPP